MQVHTHRHRANNTEALANNCFSDMANDQKSSDMSALIDMMFLLRNFLSADSHSAPWL